MTIVFLISILLQNHTSLRHNLSNGIAGHEKLYHFRRYQTLPKLVLLCSENLAVSDEPKFCLLPYFVPNMAHLNMLQLNPSVKTTLRGSKSGPCWQVMSYYRYPSTQDRLDRDLLESTFHDDRGVCYRQV